MSRIGVGKVMGVGGSIAIRLPSVLTKDDAFVLKEGDEVVVSIRTRGELNICKE